MSLTESFDKLREMVEKADSTIKSAAQQSRAEIEAKVDDARRDADTRVAELRSKTSDTATEVESHWQEMQSDWKRFHDAVQVQRQEILLRILPRFGLLAA